MHGLVNKAFQCFLRDTFGPSTWAAVVQQAQLGFDSFELLTRYDPGIAEKLVSTAVDLLGRPREGLFEDLGTYLVSHPNTEGLRRLLRFGGARFIDFLHSLDELPERGRLAMPDRHLPPLYLTEESPETFTLRFQSPIPGGGHVLVGLLRAMADDYGALVMIDHRGTGPEGEEIGITLLDLTFAEGRRFDLSLMATE
jgi:Haem-NO-binding